jgi:hypothetical protein
MSIRRSLIDWQHRALDLFEDIAGRGASQAEAPTARTGRRAAKCLSGGLFG